MFIQLKIMYGGKMKTLLENSDFIEITDDEKQVSQFLWTLQIY